jgi:antitoxin (DNA-binding transcriptional repressor) of toxin-antitoxin stability system
MPEGDPNVPAHISLTGDARFLVGEVDLGREVGMDVLVRGIEFAVHASLHEFRDRHVEAEAGSDQVKETAESYREEDARLRVMTTEEAAAQWDDLSDDSEPQEPGDSESTDTREFQVPVDQAADRMPDLLDELGRGARVVLVDQGVRVAVLTTWSSYVTLREKLAAASVAFWTAWRTGVFDVAGYATDIITVLHRPDTTPNDSDDDTEDGDRDEPEP